MIPRIVVTGTDTEIGKTTFSAGLVGMLGAHYWKPVTAGCDGETDPETVQRLSRADPARIVPEIYKLRAPASPHFAAEQEGIRIDPGRLSVPDVPGPLVIEGAGGLMVPLNRQTLFLDMFARWQLPIVLCARTALGTINHTLLSIAALRARDIPILGIAFIGDEMRDTQQTIAEFSQARILGRLPLLRPLTPGTLADQFAANFSADDFVR